MTVQRAFSIKGVGKYLPKTQVTSHDLEVDLKLPKGFIEKHIGVKIRHKAIGESNSFMGEQALRAALSDASLTLEDIDYLIGASATFDYIIPNRSSMIKHRFPEADHLDFPCLDINTVCTSFISALDHASFLLQSGEYKNIAIVSSESSLHGLNPDDPETYGLFGDGAAAVIVGTSENKGGLIKYSSKTFSQGAKYTLIEGGGNANHPKNTPYAPSLFSFKMQGSRLLKNGKSSVPKFLREFFGKLGFSLPEVDLIVPHQASKLALKMLTTFNNGSENNIFNHLANHGNCIGASIPIALVSSIESGRLREGNTCLLLGTAAGITIGGLLFKYDKG